MGLDYSISLSIRERETKVVKWDITIAYWRKAWSLCNKFQEIAYSPKYEISHNSDWLCTCNQSVLPEIVKVIKDNLDNLDSDYWTDSVFPAISTRHNSIIQLAQIYSAIQWLNNPQDDDAFYYMWEDWERRDLSILESYLNDKDKYEIVIEFDNSY